MLILPPYSRREDEQMQSILKFSGLGTFPKVPKNSFRACVIISKRLLLASFKSPHKKIKNSFFRATELRFVEAEHGTV